METPLERGQGPEGTGRTVNLYYKHREIDGLNVSTRSLQAILISSQREQEKVCYFTYTGVWHL
jgi:hypothetical protein